MYRIISLAALLTLSACQSPAPLGSAVDAVSPDSSSSIGIQGSAGYDDPYFPLLGNGGYDVEHYRIVLDVDVVTNRIEGFATIDAVADDALSRFNLDLFGLEVSSVKVNGESARFWREGQELMIVPAETLTANEPFQTTVSYSGTPEVVPVPGLPIPGIGWMHEGELIITMSEPTGAMNWHPCNNHQRDKATYEFEITVAEDYVVAANGILRSVQTRGDKKRFHFVASDPMASYLATVNIGRFEVEELVGPNELPLTFYFPPATEEKVRESFRRTPELIATLAEWFGPYPFECYGGVVAGAGPPAALETQTLPVYGGKSPALGVQIHELTHQWFGNSVSFESWRDLWLAEAFASYAEWLWVEKAGDEGAVVKRIEYLYGFLSKAEHELMGDPGVEHLFGLGVYVRGPLALHALRLEIGDEAFFGTLQAWTSTFKNSAAGAKDFIALAEEQSQQDLAEFFEAWLYSSELPAIPAMNLPSLKADATED